MMSFGSILGGDDLVSDKAFSPIDEPNYRTERLRSHSRMAKSKRQEIASRVVSFYDQDWQDRRVDEEMRLQRYAKYRNWVEGTSFPWEGASDQAIPDMMTSSLRIQDSLHNAIMSSRPSVVSKAVDKNDAERQNKIDQMLDYQFFIEQGGEKIIEEMADAFVNDGVITAFTSWVRDTRPVSTVRRFVRNDPDGTRPTEIFREILRENYPDHIFFKADEDGWDWELERRRPIRRDEPKIRIQFYHDKAVPDEWEMRVDEHVVVYEGPRVIIKNYEDVLHPVRCANLQIPSPSNPDGATHVIVVDEPSIDEIERLINDGYYDLVPEDHINKIRNSRMSRDEVPAKTQRDKFQGKASYSEPKDESHGTLTRMICFDMFDINDDGVNEDMVFWVIKETGTLLRSRPLGEAYPSKKGPQRPFSETNFLPVKGRREGISHLEQMEGLHDLTKQLVDQTVDNGTLANAPVGFYRAASSMKPERLRMFPGDMVPVSDPQNDVNFPRMGHESQSFGINMLALTDQMKERLSLVGDLQLGRVPAGKSSALRTIGGMQTVLSQGEARPERILRRFYMCYADIYAKMHDLNRQFAPDEKKFRVYGYVDKDRDPYAAVNRSKDLDVPMDFDFRANVLNSSKEALQQGIVQMLQTYLNPVFVQAGLTSPRTLYNLALDFGRFQGQDPEGRYLEMPSPDAGLPRISFEEAITQILGGREPRGLPLEPSEEHLKKLQEFSEDPEKMARMDLNQLKLLAIYARDLTQRVESDKQKNALAQAAANSQPGAQAGPPPGGPPGETSPTPVNENELLDESLPGAGGGANTGVPGVG